jgi:hypothetical protein
MQQSQAADVRFVPLGEIGLVYRAGVSSCLSILNHHPSTCQHEDAASEPRDGPA